MSAAAGRGRLRAASLVRSPGAGLLLDLDGTLLDSEPIHRESFRLYFLSRNWTVPDDVLKQFMGRRASEVFPTLSGPWDGEDPVALTRDIIAMLPLAEAKPRPIPGAALALRSAVEHSIPVAIVTSAVRPWALEALEILGAQGFLGHGLELVTAEDCAVGKPDPLPFALGGQILGIDMARSVAIEDSPAGLHSARAAGVGHLVGLASSRSAEELVAAGADETATDLSALTWEKA